MTTDDAALISAQDLIAHPASDDLVLCDCRDDMADPEAGRRMFATGHIPGAQHVRIDGDLSAPIGAHGGRHPLPDAGSMESLFSRLGIRRGITPVVAYDAGGAYAARLWWMLRYCGHDRVRVLNGGWEAWLRAGGVPSRETTVRPRAVFTSALRDEMRVPREEVRALPQGVLLVDARSPERWRGEAEPIDPVAGSIPGSVNAFWQEALDAAGCYPAAAELRRMLPAYDSRSIVYCGSGVTACANVLAADAAGLPLPRLYPGGWSDWITWKD